MTETDPPTQFQIDQLAQMIFKIILCAFPSPETNRKIVKTKIRYTPYNQQIGNYNSYRSPMSSPPRTKRDTPPRLPSKKQRSQSLTPIQPGQTMTVCAVSRFAHEQYCSADGVIQGKTALDGFDRFWEKIKTKFFNFK